MDLKNYNFDNIFINKGVKKISQGVYHSIKCPACNRNGAFFNVHKGFNIICGKIDNCAVHTHLKEFAPELWQRMLDDNTNYAYIDRGITSIPEHKRDKNYIVRKLADGSNYKRKIYGTGPKTKFEYKKNPSSTYYSRIINNKNNIIFLVEGDYDADSLASVGYNAISFLAAGYKLYENISLIKKLKEYKRVVFLADHDNAGIKCLINNSKKLSKKIGVEIENAICWGGNDANDLLKNGLFAKEKIEQTIKDCKRHAEIINYYKPLEIFEIYHSLGCRDKIIYTNFGTFLGYTKSTKDGDKLQATKVCDDILKLENTAFARDDGIFNFSVTSNKRKINFDVQSNKLSAIAKFSDEFLSKTNGFYYLPNINLHFKFINELKKDVKEINYLYNIGRVNNMFVMPGIIVNNGYIYEEDKKGIIKINNKLFRFVDENINRSKNKISLIADEYFSHLYNLFGIKAVVTFGYYVACLHAEAFFNKFNFFPFLNIVGQPSLGKSSFLTILNNGLGYDEEGLNVSNSTQKGIARMLSSRNSIPICLLEANDTEMINGLLTDAFNWQDLYTTADVKNQNKTITYPFRSGLVFAQNTTPFRDKAEFDRIINIDFDGFDKKRQISYELLNNSKDSFLELIKYNLNFDDIFNKIDDFKIKSSRRNNILKCIIFGLEIAKLKCSSIDDNIINKTREYLLKVEHSDINEVSQDELYVIKDVLIEEKSNLNFSHSKTGSNVLFQDTNLKYFINYTNLKTQLGNKAFYNIGIVRIKKVLTDNNFIVANSSKIRRFSNKVIRTVELNSSFFDDIEEAKEEEDYNFD